MELGLTYFLFQNNVDCRLLNYVAYYSSRDFKDRETEEKTKISASGFTSIKTHVEHPVQLPFVQNEFIFEHDLRHSLIFIFNLVLQSRIDTTLSI
jgi:hypothetical protein